MSKPTYFVFRGTEDGTECAECDTPEELSEYLAEYEIETFQTEYSDSNYWGDRSCLVIRGEVVVPKQKQVVTEWSVD